MATSRSLRVDFGRHNLCKELTRSQRNLKRHEALRTKSCTFYFNEQTAQKIALIRAKIAYNSNLSISL